MDIYVTKNSSTDFFKNLKETVNSTLFPNTYKYNGIGDRTVQGMITLKNIEKDGLSLRFKTPYIIQVYYEDGYCFADIEELEVYAYGSSRKELYLEIIDNLVDSWYEIVECDINELNAQAIAFRKLLIEKIEKL